ncbi:MAG: hypothetical protein RL077_4810 [Verrucomicrobiota bacterium]|jgi:hypothetical protein
MGRRENPGRDRSRRLTLKQNPATVESDSLRAVAEVSPAFSKGGLRAGGRARPDKGGVKKPILKDAGAPPLGLAGSAARRRRAV